jgi:hypothetical protein
MLKLPTKSEIDLAKKLGESAQNQLYAQTVSDMIREKYSVNTELAILRQRDTKPEEFAAYNAYAEQCKVEAKRLIFGE